jgi:4a-hydroxytetrahydrobiopterin dehydratase
MSRVVLTPEDIAVRMQRLSQWSLREGKLYRELTFDSFARAFGFMTALALIAERMNHHPVFNNVYNRVSLTLWTHDAAGLTELDFALAEAAEQLVASFANVT